MLGGGGCPAARTERIVQREAGRLHSRNALEALLEGSIHRLQFRHGVAGGRFNQRHLDASASPVAEILMLQIAEAARGAAQGFNGIGARGEPGRRRGVTPTMVKGCPSMAKIAPTTVGSEP